MVKCLSVQNCCIAKQLAFFPGAHSVKAMTDEAIIKEMVQFHKTFYEYSFFAIVNDRQNNQMEKIFNLFGYKKYPFCSKITTTEVYMYIFDRESVENIFRYLGKDNDLSGNCPCFDCVQYRKSVKKSKELVLSSIDKFKQTLQEQFGITDVSFLTAQKSPFTSKRSEITEHTLPVQEATNEAVFAGNIIRTA